MRPTIRDAAGRKDWPARADLMKSLPGMRLDLQDNRSPFSKENDTRASTDFASQRPSAMIDPQKATGAPLWKDMICRQKRFSFL